MPDLKTKLESSGRYTPSLNNTTNISASTAYQCQWMRYGQVVNVSGRVDVDPIAGASTTELGISLPIPSNLSAAGNEDCRGTHAASSAAGDVGLIQGDSVNHWANMRWTSVNIASHARSFIFTYLID